MTDTGSAATSSGSDMVRDPNDAAAVVLKPAVARLWAAAKLADEVPKPIAAQLVVKSERSDPPQKPAVTSSAVRQYEPKITAKPAPLSVAIKLPGTTSSMKLSGAGALAVPAQKPTTAIKLVRPTAVPKVGPAQNRLNLHIMPAVAARAELRPRHWGLALAFITIVLLPIAVSAWYLYARAADQYASTLGFTVRSEAVASATDLLGGLGSTFGGGGSRDSDILYEFIRSQEMVAAVNARLDLHKLYSKHRAQDPLLSFDPVGTVEDLSSYWQKMVRISYDASAGLMELRVLAFTPEDAKNIAEAIYDESSIRINALSANARADATRYASEDLDLAKDRLKKAREALTAFQVANQIVDVSANIQGQMGLLNTLQTQLAEAMIDFDLMENGTTASDPRLVQAQRRIDVIEARMAEERKKFGSGGQGPSGKNYATTVAEFESLTVDRELSERAYIAALAVNDGARADANRKSLYLAAYIRPTFAEQSEFPQRALNLGIVALFSFLAWAIGSLVYYSLRDSR